MCEIKIDTLKTAIQSEEKDYHCRICNKEFDDFRKLGGHFRSIHPG